MIVVVGAGIGGLACALALAARGVDVVVLERADVVGGKLREVVVGDENLDAGPTVLTMRHVFDGLFADAGFSLADRVPARRAATLARHAWDEHTSFDLHADVERNVDAVAAFAGAAEARRYRAFCVRAREIHATLERPFIESARPNPLSLAKRVGLSGLGGLLRISPFATMWSELSTYFHDPRLRQLFGRYATYCGSSPFAAPATLMLVAHVEQAGVWLVDGGMRRLAAAFADAIVERGGTVRTGADVDAIDVVAGRAAGVVLADGERIAASAVVFAGDSAALAEGLLGAPAANAVARIRPEARSLSALTWHLVARTSGFALGRHNVFFGANTAREFSELFDARVLPSDPTVYVCAQDRDDERRPAGPERLMCLVNAPADADRHALDDADVARCGERMTKRLAACGLVVDAPREPPVVTTPADFARLFPATGGALYGRATHGWAASFERPSSTSKVPGLYLAGGSVHPGPGLPMAALSGRLAAARVLADARAR